MSRSDLGFAIFMTLLLIAPKVPLRVSGGVADSSVSLGIVGLVLWYLACPQGLFRFPKLSLSHPLTWLVVFAIYAFVVSLLSTTTVRIAYSVQYLLYVVIGAILMRRYRYNFGGTEHNRAHSILFAIAVIYSVAVLLSVLIGPIYPHQVRTTQRYWGGLVIQQGVGFAESQNMAGPVVVFFAAACIYLYRGKTLKKWVLLCLILSALLATLSRGAIFSFALVLGFVCCLDSIKPLVQRASVKVSVLKNIGFVGFTVACLVIPVTVAIYLTNKSFLPPILSGFGLSQGCSVISRDMSLRFGHWAWGMDVWASGSLLKMVFGGGFRSSMVAADYGAWREAHNMYITILGDFGVVGLTLFLGALFRAFFRYARLFLTGNARGIEKFGLLVLLALSIDNLTGPYFYSPICLSLLIFTFAITL